MSSDNWNQMHPDHWKKEILQIFRLAEEEISDSATFFIVHNRRFFFPGNGKRLELNHHRVKAPDGSFFEFDILFAVFDGIEYVFLLEYKLEANPGKFYIKRYPPDPGSEPAP